MGSYFKFQVHCVKLIDTETRTINSLFLVQNCLQWETQISENSDFESSEKLFCDCELSRAMFPLNRASIS